MSERLALAKHLIKQEKYDAATKLLTADTDDRETLHILSLLHRYRDEYDQERAIVEKALDIAPDDAYMRERLAWHEMSYFEKSTPRNQIFSNTQFPGKEEMLKQMCFVTSTDSSSLYFDMMIEMLDSLKRLPTYGQIDINIIDCGMTDHQKQFLLVHFPAIKKIMDPGWDIPVPKDTKQGLKSIMARVYLDKHFPEYRYYFFIDADTWVQDENSLDRYLQLTQRQGFACTQEMYDFRPFYGAWGCSSDMIPDEYWNPAVLRERPYCNAGVFCVDKQSAFLKAWRTVFEFFCQKKGFQFGTDQLSLYFAIGKMNPLAMALNCIDNFLLHMPKKFPGKYSANFNSFYPNEQEQSLYQKSPSFLENEIFLEGEYPAYFCNACDGKLIGIIHFTAHTKKWFHAWQPLRCQDSEKVKNIQLSFRVLFEDFAPLNKQLFHFMEI